MIVGITTLETYVPDEKDISKIEKMLEDLGVKELEMGEVTEEDLIRLDGTGKEAGPKPSEGGAEPVPPVEELSPEAGEEEEDFAALLKDIQIGLEEEKELESRIQAAEVGEEPTSVGEEEVTGGVERETQRGEMPGIEDEGVPSEIGEETFEEEEAGVQPEMEEIPLSEAIEYISEEPEKPETEAESPPLPGVPEDEISEGEAEVAGIPEEIMEGEEEEEGVTEALEGGGDLDLPEDFDLGDIAYEEGVPEGLVSTGEAGEKAEEPEAQEEAPEEPQISEAPEQLPEETGREIEETVTGAGQALHEEMGREAEAVEEMVEIPPEIEEAALQSPEMEIMEEAAGEKAPGEEEIELPEFELPDLEAEETLLGSETGFEEMPEEKPVTGEPETVSDEFALEELLSGEAPEERPEEVPPEIPSTEELHEEIPGEIPEEGGIPQETPMDISDEDIVVIQAKLKQLSPGVASVVRDSILAGGLPVAVINEMLRLLLNDAPEQEIVDFVEQTTGRKVVTKAVPGIITVERKPGPLRNLYQNLGPLARVSGLFIVIMAILGILFMLFMYKPLRARRYYDEGITYIENAQYESAERSFSRGTQIYRSVKQYDKFGWEYMISGNYDAARKKFVAGIAFDERLRHISIRIHLAQLYTVLGEYEKADRLYEMVLARSPDKYAYIRLKGLNLIEWGKAEEPKKLDEAYELFSTAFDKKSKASDPLFKMLLIDIYQGKDDDITRLYDYITNRFPSDVDTDVYTELASYFIKHEEFGSVRDILLQVLGKDPGYPKAYMTFANYYKAIKNKQMQETFLQSAITKENERTLRYPWEKRNRGLLSNAYNDLGEIYAGMETPGRAAESIRFFKKSIDENRRNMKAYFNLAQVYFYKERNYNLAKQYYEKAEAGGYTSYDLDYNLGLLYYYEGSFTKALTRWSRLDALFPDNPYIVFAMGSAMLHLGKYNAALGEFILLTEVYDGLVKKLGEIKPWRAYHKRILLEAAAAFNNLAVAYQKLAEQTENNDFQKESLVALYKAGELADITGTERGKIQYNINYITHPDVIRGSMAINDNLSDDYRFIVQ